ncbi:hypothetical protein F4818DRAFT_441821 [Hypoxylon cercidicola]|nr:hypothetical protein F4818DRAFT_441821 [Hypoxylon cercidicola]
MFFKTAIVTAFVALFAGQVIGTATDSYAACNCPNNCKHKENSKCKFYSGASDTSKVLHGHCVKDGGALFCLAPPSETINI